MPPFGYQSHGYLWARGFFSLVIILVIVAAAIWVAMTWSREWGRPHTHTHQHAGAEAPTTAKSDALRILDERFAKGEIDAEELTARRDLLRSST